MTETLYVLISEPMLATGYKPTLYYNLATAIDVCLCTWQRQVLVPIQVMGDAARVIYLTVPADLYPLHLHSCGVTTTKHYANVYIDTYNRGYPIVRLECVECTAVDKPA